SDKRAPVSTRMVIMSLTFTYLGGGTGISYQLGRTAGCPPSGKLPPIDAVGPGGTFSCAATMRLLYKLEFGPSSAIVWAAIATTATQMIAHLSSFVFIFRIPHSALLPTSLLP